MKSKYCIYDKGPDSPIEVWKYIDDPEEALSYWYVKLAVDKYGIDDVILSV